MSDRVAPPDEAPRVRIRTELGDSLFVDAGAAGDGQNQTMIFGGLEDGSNLSSFAFNPTTLMGLAASVPLRPINRHRAQR